MRGPRRIPGRLISLPYRFLCFVVNPSRVDPQARVLFVGLNSVPRNGQNTLREVVIGQRISGELRLRYRPRKIRNFRPPDLDEFPMSRF